MPRSKKKTIRRSLDPAKEDEGTNCKRIVQTMYIIAIWLEHLSAGEARVEWYMLTR